MAKKSKKYNKAKASALAPESTATETETEVYPAPEPELEAETAELLEELAEMEAKAEAETEAEAMDDESEAPAAEDLPAVNIEYNQPTTSPYEHPIATVYIGTKKFGIPLYYLQRVPYFERHVDFNSTSAREIVLGDVYEDIGHTLIHFLFTGRYETLYAGHSLATEYRRSALAYLAARRYELDGLEEIARQQLEHFGPHVELRTVLETAREVFPDLPSDEAWFRIYLKEHFSTSFDESRDFFQREEFTNAIGQNTEFDRIIMQLTVDILLARISELEATVDEHPPAAELESESEPEPEPELDTVPVPEPLSESESLPEAAPLSEGGLEPEPEPENQFGGLITVIDISHILPADEEETAMPEPNISGRPEDPAEASLSGAHQPTPGSPHADSSVRVHDDTVASPHAESPIEIGSATEPVLESAEPEPEPEPSEAWSGLLPNKDRNEKQAGSVSVENVARPRPLVRLV
ncbi:hypothetical protein BJY00DRAFT_294565, partial [Aspergillus carlsbadensis]